MWKAILFDMDGLMIDSEGLYFRAQGIIAEQEGVTLKESTLHKMMGKKPIESLEIFRKELRIETSARTLMERRNELMRKFFREELIGMPGLSEILARFRLKKAVVTGSSEEFLKLAMEKLGIASSFDAFIHSDLVKKGKPDPEIYLKACHELKLAPGECVALEDSENGVLSAREAGCAVIAVPSEYTRNQDFSKAGYTVGSLFEAGDVIARHLEENKNVLH